MGRVLLVVLLASACGLATAPPARGDSPVRVVAAENFWGSIARQVGGDHASVTSVIVNPDTDPHAYEATPGDARTMAQAQLAIINGAGYDPWATKLLEANPANGRIVLNVADVLSKKEGDNPHFWYSPLYVGEIAGRIASDMAAIDHADAQDFVQQEATFVDLGLEAYHGAIAAIKNRYAGTRIGATESIVSYLADGTGLELITPPTYLKAINEGTDPSVADKAEVQREIDTREIKVFVFNSQNSTPDVQALVDRARGKGIPVTTVTETMVPAATTFQAWQTDQLQRLLDALGG